MTVTTHETYSSVIYYSAYYLHAVLAVLLLHE